MTVGKGNISTAVAKPPYENRDCHVITYAVHLSPKSARNGGFRSVPLVFTYGDVACFGKLMYISKTLVDRKVSYVFAEPGFWSACASFVNSKQHRAASPADS